MNRWVTTCMILCCSSAAAAPRRSKPKKAPDIGLDTARIEKLTGAKGTIDEAERVFKVSVPRNDLETIVHGSVRMTPPMGLTSWAGFQKHGKDVMVMGDLVLLEDQVSPVMDVALAQGLEVTALHNHFAWDSPRVMFMHIGGMGDEQTLARAVGKVFAAEKNPGKTPSISVDPKDSRLDPAVLDGILGVSGQYKDGVYKATIGRRTTMHGQEVGKTMGVNTWAALAGTPEAAVVDGDFAMREDELQDVLKTLRAAGIHVVAIHSHMTNEEPRIMFLHYWGEGKAEDLARGVRAALDKTEDSQ